MEASLLQLCYTLWSQEDRLTRRPRGRDPTPSSCGTHVKSRHMHLQLY
jgi:hypothetical protein